MIIFGLGLMLGFATMMAQDANPPARPCDKGRQNCPQLTVEQKAQMITDRMAKAYDLTDEQKTKLLELNTRTLSRECPMQPGAGECQHHKKDQNCRGEGGFAYVKALKEILTEEQFNAWRTDKMIERSLMPQHPQAHRGQRGGNRGHVAQRPEGGPCHNAGPAGHQCKDGHKDCKGQKKDCKKDCKDCKCSKKCAKKGCKDCKSCK